MGMASILYMFHREWLLCQTSPIIPVGAQWRRGSTSTLQPNHLFPGSICLLWSVLLIRHLKEFSFPSYVPVSHPFEGYIADNMAMWLKMVVEDGDESTLAWRLTRRCMQKKNYILFTSARPTFNHPEWIAKGAWCVDSLRKIGSLISTMVKIVAAVSLYAFVLYRKRQNIRNQSLFVCGWFFMGSTSPWTMFIFLKEYLAFRQMVDMSFLLARSDQLPIQIPLVICCVTRHCLWYCRFSYCFPN